MTTVAKSTGLIKRGTRFSKRVFVPLDLQEHYGRTEIVRSLRTGDKAKATLLAQKLDIEFAEEFETVREGRNRGGSQLFSPPARTQPLEPHEIKRLGQDHYRQVIDNDQLRRRRLLVAARKDRDAFWRGEIVPTPNDYDERAHASYWEAVCCGDDGTLEHAFQYAIDFELKRVEQDLKQRYDIGDCDEFLELAKKLCPGQGADIIERVALELLAAEYRAAQDLARPAAARLAQTIQPAHVPPQAAPPPSPASTKNPSWDELFSAWSHRHELADKQPETRKQYRASLHRFAQSVHPKRPAAVTRDDVQRYVDSRIGAGIGLRTVRYQDLAALNAVYRAAISAGVADKGINPVEDVKVPTLSGTSQKSAKQMGYNDEQARIILDAARNATDPLMRWPPFLLAYSGARVSEIVGLRACDVKVVDGIHCFEVTPEAGRHVKTGDSIRIVPLHKSIIDAGFLKFVATKAGQERLFFTPQKSPRAAPRARAQRLPRDGGKIQLTPGQPPQLLSQRSDKIAPVPAISSDNKPAKVPAEKLRRWLRELPGIQVGMAHNLAPNHAWRHRIKTIGREAGIADSVLDAITGNTPPSVGRKYGAVSIKTMAAALAKLP